MSGYRRGIVFSQLAQLAQHGKSQQRQHYTQRHHRQRLPDDFAAAMGCQRNTALEADRDQQEQGETLVQGWWKLEVCLYKSSQSSQQEKCRCDIKVHGRS